MRKPPPQEQTFLDRKREYRSQLDKPIGPSMMITVLPSITICVFLVLAAPYMKRIVEKFMVEKDEQVMRTVSTASDEEMVDSGPPPSADAVILEITKRRLKEEGFDPKVVPQLEKPKLEQPDPPEIEIEPLPILLGNSDTGLSQVKLESEANPSTTD